MEPICLQLLRRSISLGLVIAVVGGAVGSRVMANGIIESLVGGHPSGPLDPTTVSLRATSITAGAAGRTIFSIDTSIYQLDSSFGLFRIAGSEVPGFAGDGGPANQALFDRITSVLRDLNGNLWVADSGNLRIRRITSGGVGDIDTVVGNGMSGFGPDGSVATAMPLGEVSALAVDAAGNLLFAESSAFRIRLLDIASGLVTTVAGNGAAASRSDLIPSDSKATSIPLGIISSLAIDDTGRLWVVDTTRTKLLVVNLRTGLIRSNLVFFTDPDGDGTFLTLSSLEDPQEVEVSPDGSMVFISDRICRSGTSCSASQEDAEILRRVSTNNNRLVTVAGGGLPPDGVGDGLAPDAARFGLVDDLLLLQNGTILIADGLGARIRFIESAAPSAQSLIGNGASRFVGESTLMEETLLACPRDLALASDGALWFADTENHRIRRIDSLFTIVETAIGGGNSLASTTIGDGASPFSATLRSPQGVAIDANGTIYVCDTGNRRVRRVDSALTTIETVAGGGFLLPEEAEIRPALDIQFGFPTAVAASPTIDDFYVADPAVGMVHRVTVGNDLQTIAGGGIQETDGVCGVCILLRWPNVIAVDTLENVFIADRDTGKVFILDATTQIITHIAGGGNIVPEPATPINGPEALLGEVGGLSPDEQGNLWITDAGNHRIYRLDLATGALTIVAGTGRKGSSGDDGPSTIATLNEPRGLVIDPTRRHIFFSDTGNHRIRSIELLLLNPNLVLSPNIGTVNGGTPAEITSAESLPDDAQVLFGVTPVSNVVRVDDRTLNFLTPTGVFPPEVMPVTLLLRGALPFGVDSFNYLNDTPVALAHPQGPAATYFVNAGDDLQLNGTTSFDRNEVVGDSITRYEWNLGHTGTFKLTGPSPLVTAAELAAENLGLPGVYPLTLRVTDRTGAQSQSDARLQIVQLSVSPASGSLSGDYLVDLSGPDLSSVSSVRFDIRVAPIEQRPDNQTVRVRVPAGMAPAGPVDVSVDFGTERVALPGAFTYLNDPPIAQASRVVTDPGYTIRVGDSLALDGTGSADPNEIAGDFIAKYAWDLDGDGTFERRGAKVRLDRNELEAFGFNTVGDRTITLCVVDTMAARSVDVATVRVKERAVNFPNEDFSDWRGDQNQNMIDDRIDALDPTDRVDITVVFLPGTDLLTAQNRLGAFSSTPPTPIPLINALYVQQVLVSDVHVAIMAEANLFRVEQDEVLEANVDVSSAAIRSAPSTLYSPATAFDRGLDGSGVNIAIIDSGVDEDHATLAGKFVAGFNAFADNPNAFGSQSNPDDDFSSAAVFHGTRVAGVALGVDPTFPGVARGAGLVDVKILDALGLGTTGTFLAGLQWCVHNKNFPWAGQPLENHGIDVINVSLGARRRSDGRDVLSMAVNAAVAQGLIVVASAGNSSGAGSGFGPPGAADDAITVGATNDRRTVDRADDITHGSSNFGPRLSDGDGDRVDELKPDVVAPGVAINAPRGNIAPLPAVGYDQVTGSSIATSHVSGVVALMLQSAADTLAPEVVKDQLRGTAEPRGSPTDPLLDPSWNHRFGKGIVDAFYALDGDLGAVDAVWVSNSLDDSILAIEPDPSATPTSTVSRQSPFSSGGGREPLGIAVDGHGNVWLACRANASISKVNSAGQLQFRADLTGTLGALPGVDVFGVAIDSAGDAWVTLEGVDRSARVRSNGVVDPTLYPTGSAPVAVATDSSGNVWIANSGSNNVTKIDSTGTEVVGSPFAVGMHPCAIVCDRQGNAYVANRDSGDVSILQPDGTTLNILPAGLNPIEITLDRTGNIWVSNDLEPTITRIDPGTGAMLPVTLGVGPRGITVGGDGTLWVSIYLDSSGTAVQRFDSNGEFLESVGVGLAPLNRGDGSGFTYANSVEPNGDMDGDRWLNGEEIDLGSNPLSRASHPVEITLIDPDSGSLNGGTPVRLDGRGMDGVSQVLFDGNPALITSVAPTSVNVETPSSTFPPLGAVDVEIQRSSGEIFIASGGFTYLNNPPISDPDPSNDGYIVEDGQPLMLDGTGSFDPNSGDSIVRYTWTVGTTSVAGAEVTLSAEQLDEAGVGTPGGYLISLEVEDTVGGIDSADVRLNVTSVGGLQFIRGEVNQDARINLADAIFILNWLFRGADAPDCIETANTNDDTGINLADGVYLIGYLFRGSSAPPSPFPDCGFGTLQFGCATSVCP